MTGKHIFVSFQVSVIYRLGRHTQPSPSLLRHRYVIGYWKRIDSHFRGTFASTTAAVNQILADFATTIDDLFFALLLEVN